MLICVCFPVASVTFDEGDNRGGSEEETKTHSTSAPLDMPSSSLHAYPSTPLDLPSSSFSTPSAYLSPCPSLMSSSCPSAMEGHSPGGWLSPEWRCGSPLLGPRSQCSGASSPDCDQERGGCMCFSGDFVSINVLIVWIIVGLLFIGLYVRK